MGRYLERVLEFLIDLLAQLPTRRFFLAIVKDRQVRTVWGLGFRA